MIAITTLAMASCGDSVAGPTTGPFTISGTVLDFRTRAPMASAVVQLLSETQTPLSAATTDSSGRYSVAVPGPGDYLATVNDGTFNSLRVMRADYRGDLLIDTSTCIARYGTVTEFHSGKPLRGATVSLGGNAITDQDGWYLLELGCPDSPPFGNTTFISATHPDYETVQRVVGRGVQRVMRIDLPLIEGK